jgi:tetratricopeptide (TPR) repeat protein
MAAAVLLACGLGLGAQEEFSSSTYTGISVEASPQIFAVMCALDAAGFDADEGALAQMPARLALRGELLKMHGPATDALRQFYKDHALGNSEETLSRFMAFSIVVGPPPEFSFQIDRDLLSPEVLALDGFQDVLANFYKEADLGGRWTKIEPEYQPAIAGYQSSVRRIVTVSDAYVRELLKPANGRTFTVYVEPLVGNRTTFQNSGSQYVIVVGTGVQTPTSEIQHSYLHYLLDPLPLQYFLAVESKKALLEVAARAPLLPVQYRDDFEALTDECLIKAVELRLRHLPPQEAEPTLQEDDREGFILVRPLVEQLQKFEKAEPSMSYYFPDLIAGIKVDAEQKRLKSITFNSTETASSQPAPSQGNPQTSELDGWLAAGDRAISLQDGPGAEAAFEKVLGKYADEPRAEYGLAIASVLVGKAERAMELFQALVSKSGSLPADRQSGAATDPAILAWSHVYLGRIHDLSGERDSSLSEYRAALAIDGAPESARVAAQRGVDAAYKAPSHPGDTRNP